MTTQYAQERKLEQIGRSSLKLSGLGSGPALRSTYCYKVTLTRMDGQKVDLIVHRLETIASNLDAIDPRILRQAFPEVPEGGLEGASGRVSLLIGQDNLRLFPVEARRSGGMTLFKSQLGTGWIASGNAGGIEPPAEQEKEVEEGILVLVAQESKHFQTPEFLSWEAMGVDLPRRCPSCKSCKECQFRTSAVSYKEDQEFHVVLEGLKFNVERRKWTASYPFFIPPSELKDNYQQVKTYTERMEKRLSKQGRVEEFNSQFRDTVERGVFRELSEEELREWKGPFNYIAMVEAFKNGPHATTPLRICINSSLKQPPPVKKSLNDCLMKGPPALVDLFTVTLSFREHRYALTKDLSKFDQRVEADDLAQHMRRVLWRDCDGSKACECMSPRQ